MVFPPFLLTLSNLLVTTYRRVNMMSGDSIILIANAFGESSEPTSSSFKSNEFQLHFNLKCQMPYLFLSWPYLFSYPSCSIIPYLISYPTCFYMFYLISSPTCFSHFLVWGVFWPPWFFPPLLCLSCCVGMLDTSNMLIPFSFHPLHVSRTFWCRFMLSSKAAIRDAFICS